MEPQVWQEVQEEAGAAAPVAVVAGAGTPATPLPVCGVPMKGVILANRKTIFHKTRICPRLSLGSCHLGTRCNFAHSLDELKPAPNLDRTKLCPSVLHPGTACPAKAKGETCRFAHSKAEIRHTSDMFKTNMCLKWIRGKCKKEAQCNHAHGHQELKYYRSLAMASGARDFARESEATMSRRRKQGNASGAVAAGGGSAASGGSRGLHGWKESGGSGNSSRGHGYHRSSRSSKHQHGKNNNDNGSVNAVLAALYEELLKGTGRREGSYSSSGGLSSFQDDSTTATDELSDFSSFSSRGLSDALCPSAPTPTTSSFGGCLHSSTASDVFQATTPSCVGTPTTSLSSSSDLSLDVNRLLLLRAIAGDNGGLLMGACDQQEEEMNQSPTTTAASLTNEGESMRQLEANLARLCLADVPARQHYYTEPPPGFEHLQQRRQQQQHAVVDLERLVTADGLN